MRTAREQKQHAKQLIKNAIMQAGMVLADENIALEEIEAIQAEMDKLTRTLENKLSK